MRWIVLVLLVATGSVAVALSAGAIPGPSQSAAGSSGHTEATLTHDTHERRGTGPAADYVRCASSDPRLDMIPDYAAPARGEARVSTPGKAVARFLALPVSPGVSGSAYTEFARSSSSALWVARERSTIVSAIWLLSSNDHWRVADFSGCQSFLNQ